MMDIRDTQNRLGRAATYGGGGDEDEAGGEGTGGGVRGRYKTEQQQADRKAQRSRYQFEATASDDEMEDEIDDNLDELSQAVRGMKTLGLAMGQEVDNQIGRIGRIEEKTTNLDNRVWRNTERVRPLYYGGSGKCLTRIRGIAQEGLSLAARVRGLALLSDILIHLQFHLVLVAGVVVYYR